MGPIYSMRVFMAADKISQRNDIALTDRGHLHILARNLYLIERTAAG